MEAIILAGGKAERLGDAAEGRPKALVPVGGKPLVGYQVGRLAADGDERLRPTLGDVPEPLRLAAGEDDRFHSRYELSSASVSGSVVSGRPAKGELGRPTPS